MRAASLVSDSTGVPGGTVDVLVAGIETNITQPLCWTVILSGNANRYRVGDDRDLHDLPRGKSGIGILGQSLNKVGDDVPLHSE
jgi:hypothetical protein